MRVPANSMIAKRPGYLFALVNGSGAFFALLMYFSGTPINLILITSILTLAFMNTLLIVLRRNVTKPEGGASMPSAPSSPKRVRLYVGLSILMLLSSLFQFARPGLPSDVPMGVVILLGSLAFLFMAWKQSRRAG